MYRLVVRHGPEEHHFRVDKDERTSLGSSEEADIRLAFPGVSREHAVLFHDGTGFVLEDRDSKNGLLVQGRRLDRVRIARGRIVQIGAAHVLIEEVPTSDADIALALHDRDSPSGSDPSTANVDVTPDVRAPVRALRFVRALDSSTPQRIARDREALFRRALSILGATALVLFREPDPGEDADGLTILRCFGSCSQELLDELARISPALEEVVPILEGRRYLLLDRGPLDADSGATCLGAVFPGPVAPWARDFFHYLAGNLADRRRREDDPPDLPPAELRFPDGMVPGTSAAMKGLLRQLEATVNSELDVLLLGETGTGKELLARTIHMSGPTKDGPFVAINCAAIPSELLEAELFGVVSRAATGVDPRPGHFVQAEGGTILLDEIGEMSDRLQAKLLRTLQEREVLPVGGSKPRKITVRIVAASNRNVPRLVQEGAFRADLYYRLRGLQFHIPPLRDRIDDIPELVASFAEKAAARYGKRIAGVSRKALRLLVEHSWPGNVRELETEVERAVLLCASGASLETKHFAPIRWARDHARESGERRVLPGDDSSLRRTSGHGPRSPEEIRPLEERVDEVERRAIAEALQVTGGNKSAAARLLGISRNGLSMKMERLGIEL